MLVDIQGTGYELFDLEIASTDLLADKYYLSTVIEIFRR